MARERAQRTRDMMHRRTKRTMSMRIGTTELAKAAQQGASTPSQIAAAAWEKSTESDAGSSSPRVASPRSRG